MANIDWLKMLVTTQNKQLECILRRYNGFDGITDHEDREAIKYQLLKRVEMHILLRIDRQLAAGRLAQRQVEAMRRKCEKIKTENPPYIPNMVCSTWDQDDAREEGSYDAATTILAAGDIQEDGV